MRKRACVLFLMLVCTILFYQPATAEAASGNGWYINGSVLHITDNMSNYHLAASSSPYCTTSPFEKGTIANDVYSIVVEEGVTMIGGLTFFELTNVTSVSLPSTLKYIYGEAFMRCRKLTSITIPASVEQIGSYAFSECSSLKTVVFEGNVPALNGYSYWYSSSSSAAAFSGVDLYYDSGNTWTTYAMNRLASGSRWHDVSLVNTGSCGDTATWTYNTRNVLTISGSGNPGTTSSGNETPWYEYNNEITTVVVRTGITSITSYDFANMTNLTSVSLPTTLTSI